MTRRGPRRVRGARTRQRAFVSARRAAEGRLWIREAVLRGLRTRAGGRGGALLTEEPVRAQTVSRRTWNFDQARRSEDWRSLLLAGVSRRVRRPSGRKQVPLVGASGVRADGTRHRLGVTRRPGESQRAWEGLVRDRSRRGLAGRQLQLVVTEGCVGWAAARQRVSPRAAPQRCGVPTRRQLLGAGRRRDHAARKAEAQAIEQATSRSEAEGQAPAVAPRGRDLSPQLLTRWRRELPELLACCQSPRALWRQLRRTQVRERCVVEGRRRTRPMGCVVTVHRGERRIFSRFNRFHLEWRQQTLRQLTPVA